jgi:hypothetical protein
MEVVGTGGSRLEGEWTPVTADAAPADQPEAGPTGAGA